MKPMKIDAALVWKYHYETGKHNKKSEKSDKRKVGKIDIRKKLGQFLKNIQNWYFNDFQVSLQIQGICITKFLKPFDQFLGTI